MTQISQMLSTNRKTGEENWPFRINMVVSRAFKQQEDEDDWFKSESNMRDNLLKGQYPFKQIYKLPQVELNS